MTKKRSVKPATAHSSKLIFLWIIAFALILSYGGWYGYTHLLARPAQIDLIGSNTGLVDLSLSPATVNMAPNTDQTITLGVNAGTTKSTGAQVELSYDPAIVGTPTVTIGDFFTNSLIGAKVENGKISFTYAVPPELPGKAGTGTVATIKIHPIKAGDSLLSFTSSTLVTAIDHDAGHGIDPAVKTNRFSRAQRRTPRAPRRNASSGHFTASRMSWSRSPNTTFCRQNPGR